VEEEEEGHWLRGIPLRVAEQRRGLSLLEPGYSLLQMSLRFWERCYHDERMPMKNKNKVGQRMQSWAPGQELRLLTSSTSMMVKLEFPNKPLSADSSGLSAAGFDTGWGMLMAFSPLAASCLRKACSSTHSNDDGARLRFFRRPAGLGSMAPRDVVFTGLYNFHA
jgi:hypothetical protein